MGRCNPAGCNHHVSFRTWHFLCKRTRSSEGRRRADIPERNSRLVPATFPGSDALLSCNHDSNAGSVWLVNIAQEGLVELDAESLSCVLFSKLCNFEQTEKRPHRNLECINETGIERDPGSPHSLPRGAACARKFLNLQPRYRPLLRIFFECRRVMAHLLITSPHTLQLAMTQLQQGCCIHRLQSLAGQLVPSPPVAPGHECSPPSSSTRPPWLEAPV